MSQKYKHKNMCIVLLLLFLTFPITCMEIDSTIQVNSKKRKRNSHTSAASKKQKREFIQDDLLDLWLYKKISKCEDYDTLSNESLALLLKQTPEVPQIVANELYAIQIDPFFIAKLLCDHNAKPERIFAHTHNPHVVYGNNKLFLKCNRQRGCDSKHEFRISKASDIHVEKKDLLRAPLYHAWQWVKKASRQHHLTPPKLLLKETSGDLVTTHVSRSVYRWPVGEQFAQNKKLFSGQLTLEEVLLLKHMQKTPDPLNKDRSELKRTSRDNIDQLQNHASSLPRAFRLMRRKKQKEDAEKTKES